jgi:hypothetical protein
MSGPLGPEFDPNKPLAIDLWHTVQGSVLGEAALLLQHFRGWNTAQTFQGFSK